MKRIHSSDAIPAGLNDVSKKCSNGLNSDSNFRIEHKAIFVKIDADTCVELYLIYFHYFIYEWKLNYFKKLKNW